MSARPMIAIVLMILMVAACSAGHSIGSPDGSASASPISSTVPASTHELTRDEAVRLAQGVVAPDAPVVRAVVGSFGTLKNAGTSQPPSRYVWAITFAWRFQGCVPGPSPEPSPCPVAAPGEWTVVLDAYSGERLLSYGGSGPDAAN